MRILIVEDDQELAASLKKGLELSAYAVDVVFDGATGESYALHGEYDAAIVDWMLPEQTGIALCQAVRRARNNLPIILLTAKSTAEQKIEGLDAGADDYLAKPFAFGELQARLRALLRRPATLLPATLSVGSLSFDTVSRQVWREGREIALSARESAILELFLRQPNRLLSKQQIVAAAWDDDADVLAATVESHIANLRSKIDKPFQGPPIIETVWGKGYIVRHDVTHHT